jgi:hypothetical protein
VSELRQRWGTRSWHQTGNAACDTLPQIPQISNDKFARFAHPTPIYRYSAYARISSS